MSDSYFASLFGSSPGFQSDKCPALPRSRGAAEPEQSSADLHTEDSPPRLTTQHPGNFLGITGITQTQKHRWSPVCDLTEWFGTQ